MKTVAERLRERADSYSRDAGVLWDLGDRPTALALRTIARELREVADDFAQVPA